MSSIARQLNGLHFVFILLGQITTLEMVQITACISNKLQQIQNKKWNRMMNREKRKESGELRKNRKRIENESCSKDATLLDAVIVRDRILMD